MRTQLLIGAVMVAASVLITYEAIKPESPDILLGSVVRVQTTNGSGSAVAIGIETRKVEKTMRFTLLLTVAHVVGDESTVQLHLGTETFTGTVLKVDKKLDLALIETRRILKTIPLATNPTAGMDVWVVGYPLARGDTITHGWLTELMGNQIEASASVYPGNSGGGLFVYQNGYKIAGIVDSAGIFALVMVPAFANTVEFSVPLNKIRKFIGG